MRLSDRISAERRAALDWTMVLHGGDAWSSSPRFASALHRYQRAMASRSHPAAYFLSTSTTHSIEETPAMKSKFAKGLAFGSLALVGFGALYAQVHDKYSVQVPGGLAFSEFKGYESWQMIGVSQQGGQSADKRGDGVIAVILGNPVMIEALAAGIPDNGQPFPNGARMAKMHYAQKSNALFPAAIVSGEQLDIDFMIKDSERFADGGGWGYAAFKYDAASGAFRPFTAQDRPPQRNDAKCGVACHSRAKSRDYVFTEYATR
jgi:hypothetical protein